jgi:hypothetical protein
MRTRLILLITLLLVIVPIAAQESDGVAVTIYNEGTALIQDQRTFTLTPGVSTLDFTDVAATIDATSVSFVSITDPDGTRVLEQNYVYDLVNSDALLRRYIDQVITVVAEDGTVFSGTLLSGSGGGLILQDEDGSVQVLNSVRNIQFPELPDGLITRPTLRWLLDSAGGAQQVELTYLAGGMNWQADYTILLATDNQSLDLNGWITLNNNSGTTYEDTLLKLVAGDLNRVEPQMMARSSIAELEVASDAFAGAPPVSQREFFEYQLYEIGRPVTIGNNESKQIEFVAGTDVPASTFYVYDASYPFYGYYNIISDQYYGEMGITDVQSWLEFTTDAESGLGEDMPAGRVRVYQQDTDGAALLIGENTIDHTPSGEDVQFFLGNAFDLRGERIQSNFQMVTGRVIQETFEITLSNHKDDEVVQIRVPERLYRWSNWEILNTSHPYEKLNAHTIEFRVDVPPGEDVVVTYTVQYSWP